MTALLVSVLNTRNDPGNLTYWVVGPPWQNLLKYKVVVVSCLDASILQNARLTNAELMRLEHQVISALHPRKQATTQCHWTHLLIDEVSNGTP